MPRSVLLLATMAVLLVACQTTRPSTTPPVASLQERIDSLETRTDSLSRAASLRNPLLNSTLWTQTSVEYAGTARQAYRLAEVMMDRALADSTWTASLEQAENGSEAYRDKPPAVVLDVDETVLDNSPYQARLTVTMIRTTRKAGRGGFEKNRRARCPGPSTSPGPPSRITYR